MLAKWLKPLIQRYIEENVEMKDTWELEEVRQKGVKLPYVLMENQTLIINRFFLPISIVSIQLEVYNQEITVGKIRFKGLAKIPMKSQKSITLEVRMSHITAFFNAIRYLLTDKIPMQVRGSIQLKLLWMLFELPVEETIMVPRNKIQWLSAKSSPTEKPEKTAIETAIPKPLPVQDPGIMPIHLCKEESVD